jgi:hypothetical protein
MPGADALLSTYAGMLRVRLFDRARGRPGIPVPCSPSLEVFAAPTADDVVGAVRQVAE